MKTRILNILCEGQTEERFVKEVLKPFMMERGLVVKPRLLVTSKKKDGKGGIISFQQVKGDLQKWAKEVSNYNSEEHWFTTMFDFYALPTDFPGYSDSFTKSDCYERVQSVEDAFAENMNMHRFIPYIQLHEFEALMFSEIERLKKSYPKCSKDIDKLNEVLATKYQGNPELVNHHVDTAPSKWIIKAIEDKKFYRYNKPMSGAQVTKDIGMVKLMERCEHFKSWIDKLIAILASPNI